MPTPTISASCCALRAMGSSMIRSVRVASPASKRFCAPKPSSASAYQTTVTPMSLESCSQVASMIWPCVVQRRRARSASRMTLVRLKASRDAWSSLRSVIATVLATRATMNITAKVAG